MSRKPPSKQQWLLRFLTLVFMVLAGSACNSTPEETNLPFETIERTDMTAGTGIIYEASEPGLSIIATSNEVSNLFTTQTQQALQSADFNQLFYIAVFQGRNPSSGYGININRVSRLGDIVNIYAHFNEPVSGSIVLDVETSPYYLVKIKKDTDWGRVITFNLIVSETTVISLTHLIP